MNSMCLFFCHKRECWRMSALRYPGKIIFITLSAPQRANPELTKIEHLEIYQNLHSQTHFFSLFNHNLRHFKSTYDGMN